MRSASIEGETQQDGVVEVNSGLNLHYVEWGASHPGADTPTLLLLHGSVGNARVWDPFARALIGLSYRGRLIALDLRGHGESDWANPPAYKCGDYVCDLEKVVERLGLGQVVLVAHSMAVYHSIRFAVLRSESVAGLVLIDIEAKCRNEHIQLLRSAGRKPHPVFSSIEEAIERERRVFPFATDGDLRAFVASNLRESATESGRRATGGLIYKYDRASIADFDDYDERDNLAKIECPSLVVYGKQSPLGRPDEMQKMAYSIAKGGLAAIDRAGHLPQLDNPNGLAEAVLAFLDRLE